mmetsp:Transcript_27730/g.76314  ORF Transcript_27730/g.76314 Transcript_27730/m.76314 type:complete len:340 (+) Transcript_27730:194-1213(+)
MLRQRKGDSLLPLHTAPSTDNGRINNVNKFGVKRNHRGKSRRGTLTVWDQAQRWLVGISVAVLFMVGSYKLAGRLFNASDEESHRISHSSPTKQQSKSSRGRQRHEEVKKKILQQQHTRQDGSSLEQQHPRRPRNDLEILPEQDGPKSHQYPGETVVELQDTTGNHKIEAKSDHAEKKQQEQQYDRHDQHESIPKDDNPSSNNNEDRLDDKASNADHRNDAEDDHSSTKDIEVTTTTVDDARSNATRCVALLPGGSTTAIITLTPDMINDDYCDCANGMDEHETSACSHVLVHQAVFDCGNGSTGSNKIATSRVRDGVTDCPMTGADEKRIKVASAATS